MTESICINNLYKNYKNNEIFNDISFSFPTTGIYFLKGKNGSGKTTLLRLISGLVLPDKGSINVYGENSLKFSNSYKKNIGFVFSNERALYYKLTGYENILYYAKMYGISIRDQKNIAQLADKFDIDINDKKYVETYSSGMKKKILLIRTFVSNPKILLLDEPFDSLDEKSCQELKKLIIEYSNNALVILTSHQTKYIPTQAKIVSISKGKLTCDSVI